MLARDEPRLERAFVGVIGSFAWGDFVQARAPIAMSLSGPRAVQTGPAGPGLRYFAGQLPSNGGQFGSIASAVG
jgi:hypothetical protein